MNLECCLGLTDAGVIALGRLGLSGVDSGERAQMDSSPVLSPTPNQLALPSASDERSEEYDDFDNEAAPIFLQSLSVSGCVRLTDESIVSVARRCHRLAHVDLSQVYDLTDASVVTIAQSCGPYLRTIKLSRCGRITDLAVIALAENCPGLTDVTVDDCYALTDASIVALVQRCRLLRALDLSHCPRLTDQSVIALTEFSTALKSLIMRFPIDSLVGPSLLTDRSLLALAAFARGTGRGVLKEVDLTGHPRLYSAAASSALASVNTPPQDPLSPLIRGMAGPTIPAGPFRRRSMSGSEDLQESYFNPIVFRVDAHVDESSQHGGSGSSGGGCGSGGGGGGGGGGRGGGVRPHYSGANGDAGEETSGFGIGEDISASFCEHPSDTSSPLDLSALTEDLPRVSSGGEARRRSGTYMKYAVSSLRSRFSRFGVISGGGGAAGGGAAAEEDEETPEGTAEQVGGPRARKVATPRSAPKKQRK